MTKPGRCPPIDAALVSHPEAEESEEPFELRFAVMRHADRADEWGNHHWHRSDDFAQWPMDPPLTAEGIALAGQVGEQLAADLGGNSGHSKSFTIISSPFFRCVQTAVELCRVAGPGSKILLDNELGEVFGHDLFGEVEPEGGVTRSMEEIVAYCHLHDVEVEVKKVGLQPPWPENLPQGRFRLLCRFLHYLDEGHALKRNFALVTHSEGVAAALSAMPSMQNVSVGKVDYCGYILGSARLTPTANTANTTNTAKESLPLRPYSEHSEKEPRYMHETEASKRPDHSGVEGWLLKQFRVELKDGETEALTPRIRRWSGKSRFSEDNIRQLLRYESPRRARSVSKVSSCSTETPSCTPSTSLSSNASTCEGSLVESRCEGFAESSRVPETRGARDELLIEARCAAGRTRVPSLCHIQAARPCRLSEKADFSGKLSAVTGSSLLLRRNALKLQAL